MPHHPTKFSVLTKMPNWWLGIWGGLALGWGLSHPTVSLAQSKPDLQPSEPQTLETHNSQGFEADEPQTAEPQTVVLNPSSAPFSPTTTLPATLFKPPKPLYTPLDFRALDFRAQTPPDPLIPIPPPVQPNPTPEPQPAPTAPEFSPIAPPIAPSETATGTACIHSIVVAGSTVFSPAELDAVVQTQIDPAQAPSCLLPNQETGYQITFEQLIQARTALTDFYVEQGYVTSGAFIPEQTIAAAQITIQVIEGRLEAIEISGNPHLSASYIRDRLAIAGATPLNQDQLIAGLQLLQQDPLIETINAELAAGIEPSSSILKVQVQEARVWQGNVGFDNARSANVGTVRRQVQAGHQNVLGFGDRFTVGLTDTSGSGTFDLSYSVPLNPRNGRLTLSYSTSDSRVIRDPFDVLNIESDSDTYELSFRQPLQQTPSEEFAVGLTFSRHESTVTLNPLNTGELPFPTRGSDSQGQTRISTLRLFQDWVKRNENQVLAARSQFNLGVDLLGTTQNTTAPDGQFFSWQGQGQWVRRLGRDTLLVVRGNVQWGDRPLPSVEQLGIGGAQTVRGYPQSALTTDGGAMATAEVRLPILRVPETEGLLQLTPFIDFGIGWNVDEADPSPNALTAVGLGLLWQDGTGWSARLDWGIPLTEITTTGNSAQEDGLHFSINWSPF